MSNLGIGVSIFLRDQFSSTASRVQGSMRNLSRNAMRMNHDSLRAIRAQNLALAGMGAIALRGIGSAVKVGAEFGQTMQFVSSVTGATGSKMDELSDKALSLGKNTMFTARKVASGMQFMAMAGMSQTDVMGSIGAATNLAGATKSSLGGVGGAADVLTNIMNMFKVGADKSTEFADILATATTSTNTNLHMMGESMRYAGGKMKELNIPMLEGAAMVGILANAGVQATQSGTALANMWRYLTKAQGDFATGRQSQAMAGLGLSPKDFADENGNLKDRGQIFATIASAAQKQTNLDGVNMMDALFGIRGGKAIGPLLRDLEGYEKLVDKIKTQGPGSSAKFMGDMMGTTKGNIDKMTSAWESFQITFSKSIEPLVVPLIKGITMIINGFTWLTGSALGPFIASGVAGFILIRTLAAVYRVILTTIGLTYGKNTAAFASRVATTTAGYVKMTQAAARYNVIAAGGKYGSGGIMYNADGTQVKSGLGRAQRGGRGKGIRGRVMSADLKDRYNQRFGGGLGMMGRMGRSGMGRGLMAGLGRVAGVLTGPVGMALSFVLPAAIGGLISALDSNTDSTNKMPETFDPLRRIIISNGTSNFVGISRQGLPDATKPNLPDELYGKGSNTHGGSRPGTTAAANAVHIYVDGVEATAKKEAENVVRANIEPHI